MSARPSTALRHESYLREMAAAKWTQKSMANALGVAPSTISKSLTVLGIPHAGKSWSRRAFATPRIVESLREQRMAIGWSREDLERKSGYHRSQISEWERGVREIPITALLDIATALGREIIDRPLGA